MKRASLFILLVFICSACSGIADFQGIVIEVDKDQLLIATEMTKEEYEALKDKDPVQIQNEDVSGEEYYGLISLYENPREDIEKGDMIEVWIDGDVMESYPEQAYVKKIIKQETE